jgi:hypothetical protein
LIQKEDEICNGRKDRERAACTKIENSLKNKCLRVSFQALFIVIPMFFVYNILDGLEQITMRRPENLQPAAW